MSFRDGWTTENNFTWDHESIQKELDASQRNSVSLLRNIYNSLDAEVETCIKRKVRREVFKQRISNHCIETCEDRGITLNISSDVIKFNAGGKVITVKRQRVTPRSKDIDLLYTVICGRWNHRLPLDKDNRVFLNINPAWIEPVIDYLRDGSRSKSMKSIRSRLNESDALGLDAVLAHFGLSGLIDVTDPENKVSDSVGIEVIEARQTWTAAVQKIHWDAVYEFSPH